MQCQVVTAHATENDGRADVVEHLEKVSYSYTDSEKNVLNLPFQDLSSKDLEELQLFFCRLYDLKSVG